MMPMPVNITKTPVIRPPAVTGKKSPYPTVVIVTTAHHSACPPVSMLAPGAPLSNPSSITLARTSTTIAAMTVIAAAYWPRFWRTSWVISLLPFVRISRVIRDSRLSRASRNRPENRKIGTFTVGIDPSRSSHPRRSMK
jgi:hypothetical protein